MFMCLTMLLFFPFKFFPYLSVFSLDRCSIPSREVFILWSYLVFIILFSCNVYLIFFLSFSCTASLMTVRTHMCGVDPQLPLSFSPLHTCEDSHSLSRPRLFPPANACHRHYFWGLCRWDGEHASSSRKAPQTPNTVSVAQSRGKWGKGMAVGVTAQPWSLSTSHIDKFCHFIL